jgi:hypothetical protein
MSFCPGRMVLPVLFVILAVAVSLAQAPAQSSSSSAQPTTRPAKASRSIDPGAVSNNVYRNKTLGFTCKIPDAWVLRTDEMNAKDDDEETPSPDSAPGSPPPASSAGSKVLLAAFSRPPAARGEDINSSIVIAAEPVASYPGLKEAAEYFYPIEEVAKAQSLLLDEDPYAITIGATTLVRGDFHKDVGTRVLHQSTLVLLSHGYAVSITLIAGTTDEVEDLIDGLSFSAAGKK